MKDIFKRTDDEICAKLVTAKDGALPLFAKTILRANTVMKYEGIPVFVLDGFYMHADTISGEIAITGELQTVSDLRVLKEVTEAIKAIKKVDMSDYPKAGLAFFIVFASSEFLGMPNWIFGKSENIKFDKLEKFKIRGKTLKLEGFSHSVRSDDVDFREVSPKKDDDLDTKSFVVDEKEELI